MVLASALALMPGMAQPQINLDSLWHVWNDPTEPVAERLRAMSWISIDGFLYTDPDSGYALARMQYDLAARHGHQRFMGIATTTMGNYHLMRGDYAAALDRLTQARGHFGAGDDTSAMIMANSNLGALMEEMGDVVRALDMLRQSLAMATQMRDTSSMCQALNNLGTALLSMADTMDAEAYFKQCLDLDPGRYDKRIEALASTNLGIIRSAGGNQPEAERLHSRALTIAEDHGFVDLEALALHNLASQQLRQSHLGRAEALAREALDLSTRTTQTEQMANAANLLYDVLKQRGRTGEALAMLERKLEIEKDLRAEEGRKEVMRGAYERKLLADSLTHVAERAALVSERTIADLRAGRTRNRAWMAAGAGILLLLGYGLWNWTDRRRRQERFEKEAAHLEVQALRSQMNPHFIFNALTSINAYMQDHDQDSASTFLTRFARVMRGVLENSRHSEVPLQDDMDTLRGYMELERMRMQDKFDFTITVAPDLDPEAVLVPPLVAQPFVENAIWHGMAAKQGRGRIDLRVERNGDELVWTIEDDGPGRPTADAAKPPPTDGRPAKRTSLGTAITRARLDLVRKQTGGAAGFEYEDLHPGTRVRLHMPILS